MKRPRLRITLIDRKGSCPCHHGHKIGDSWDFDTERGQLCPMAMHVAFLYADIMAASPVSRTAQRCSPARMRTR